MPAQKSRSSSAVRVRSPARASAAISPSTAGLRVTGAGIGRGTLGGLGRAGVGDVVMLTPHARSTWQTVIAAGHDAVVGSGPI